MKYALMLAALVAAATIALPASAAYETQKYFDGAMPYRTTTNSGWNYWKTNRLWRPSGKFVALHFNNNNGVYWLGYEENLYDNPFTIYGAYGYSRGWCDNLEWHMVDPFTCQVFNWYA